MEMFDCDVVVYHCGDLSGIYRGVYKNKRVPDVTKLDNVKNAVINGGSVEYEKLTPEMLREKDPGVVKLAAIIAATKPDVTVGLLNEEYAELIVEDGEEKALIKRFDSPQKITASKVVADAMENLNAEMYKLVAKSDSTRKSEDERITVTGIDPFFSDFAKSTLRELDINDTDPFIEKIGNSLFPLYDYGYLETWRLKEDNKSVVLDVLSAGTVKLWHGYQMSEVLLDVYKSDLTDEGKVAVAGFLLGAFPESVQHF